MAHSTSSAPSSVRARGFSFGRGAAAGVLLAALVGCQAASPAATTLPPAPTAPAATATLAPTAGPTAPPAQTPRPAAPTPIAEWPRTVVDDEGTQVTLAAPPQRIASLTPATTELVFELGEDDRLVGRGEYDDHPPAAAELPAVATFTGVIHEQLVALEPDLVLAGGNFFTPPGDIERMRELGIPVLVLYAPTVDAVLADILLVGEAIGATDAADELTADMRARMAEVTAAVADLERPRVFYQLGSEPEIYGPAPGSFIAHMIELAGGEPITTTDPAVFAISVERLVEEDPQVILVGDALFGACPGDVVVRPGWEQMTAVADGAVREVDDTIITRPGPRLAEGLAALALAIHPDAELRPPTTAPAVCSPIL